MNRILGAIETVAAVFLLLIALLTAGNVILRGLFSYQVPDWFDLSRQIQGIAIFWGIALATWFGSHICVDVLWEALQSRGKRIVDVVATLIIVLFLAPLVWMLWVKVGTTGSQTTMDLRLPLVWFYSVGALGVTVALGLGAVRLLVLVRGKAVPMALQAVQAGTHGS